MFEDHEKDIALDVQLITDFFKQLRKGVIRKKDINTINLMALDGIDMAYCCFSSLTQEEGDKIRKRTKRKLDKLLKDTDWK